MKCCCLLHIESTDPCQTIISAVDTVLEKRLNKDDATDIVRHLLDVQSKAKTLGRLLKVPKAIIDVTPQSTSDPQAPLFHIIDECLKQVDPKPTWRLILNALRDPLIGEHSLAQEIEVSLTMTSSSTLPGAHPSSTTSVPLSTSTAYVLQSTSNTLRPTLATNSKSLSVSHSSSAVVVSGAASPRPGSGKRKDSYHQTTKPSQQVVKHYFEGKPTPIRTRGEHYRPHFCTMVIDNLYLLL